MKNEKKNPNIKCLLKEYQFNEKYQKLTEVKEKKCDGDNYYPLVSIATLCTDIFENHILE